ncbi:aldehyde dehydrogenase [Lysinibacillus macroides]|uniref:Aldehyde dehydrogenase n=1 Tax=Lysinibacillus macroides TaxID=33935 RepID=A0A0M9DNP6_9BACI|nr:aldehyde dehydrogenase [Lysinibacillus macroides]
MNGEWVKTNTEDVIESINPANGEINGKYEIATEEMVNDAVKAARVALEGDDWKRVTRKQRAKILQAIAALIREHQSELATLETLDNGKLYNESWEDMTECAELFEYYAGWTDKFYTENNPVEGDFLSVTTADPIGICGQIVPFNFPLQMAALKMAPALAMANTVLLKPANATSFSAIRFFEILHNSKLLPPGTVNLLVGNSRVGSWISRHPDIDKLSFTGSTNVGKQLLHDSADSNLKPVTLELGGKSPNIIFADYPKLDAAIERSFIGLFTHKGEKCSSPTRLFVQKPIYDEVVEKISQLAREYKCGDPFNPQSNQGAQCTKAHMESILAYIESAKEEGARITAGGERDTDGSNAKGYFIKPTILADVHNKMKVAQEEIFGPVLCVIPFDTEEEVIAMANDTIYGLGAGLWTGDTSRAHRVANQLKAGMVFVNRYGCYDMASPFGGIKQSGWGKEYAIHSLNSFISKRAIWFAY